MLLIVCILPAVINAIWALFVMKTTNATLEIAKVLKILLVEIVIKDLIGLFFK